MKIEGKRAKQVRWVHVPACVVRLELEAVIPPDDPSEPCFEPQTIEFPREVCARAEAGDIDWLRKVSRVYAPVPG